jgi:hypothetical protein
MALRSGLALVLLLAGNGFAQQSQGTGTNRYEQRAGPPVDVSIEDLVHTPDSYDQRSVRTTGRLDLDYVGRSHSYMLRGGFSDQVEVTPVPEVAAEFESDGGARWIGQQVQVTGVFQIQRSVGATGAARFRISFWAYVGPPEKGKDKNAPIDAPSVGLEALLAKPGARDGQLVRVVGKFRGKNLYGDLPSRSERNTKDWVIKDDLFAVWVTGKKPKGSGWELDAGLKRDTGKWIEVVGRPETSGQVTYIRALQVNLTSPPTATAEAQPPPPPPERPKVPPVVVFALPLDGDHEVASLSRFIIQFSKDMEEASFKDHVVLRYAGARRPGDRLFDGAKLSYDGGRRALTVDPGDVLRPGRQIELLLMPGIVDIDGLALVPRPGQQLDGAVDALRFETSS